MSILNPILMGGGSWKTAINTSGGSAAISFTVDFEPSEWTIMKITDKTISSSSTYYIISVCEKNGAYSENGLSSNVGVNSNAPPTTSYSSGTFTVTRASTNDYFTNAAGDYLLIYI